MCFGNFFCVVSLVVVCVLGFVLVSVVLLDSVWRVFGVICK